MTPTEKPADHAVRLNRTQLSLDGLSVGDAFGERFFGPLDRLVGMIQQRAMPRAPWMYTDDTEMALAIVQVLDDHGRIDQDALARVFGIRYANNPARGYGGTAHGILEAIRLGEPWRAATSRPFDGTGSKGNGGAMRAAPIGAYFADDPRRVVTEARASAEVTHFHPEGQAGAIAVAVAAAWASRWRETRPPAAQLFDVVLEHTPPGATRTKLEEARTLPLDSPPPLAARRLGSGENVLSEDTVPYSVWCAARHLDNYEEALWSTVTGLGDIDTTCAIVGGIVALSAGREAIPTAWLESREPLQRRV